MREIRLNLRKTAVAQIILGMLVISAGIWLGVKLQGGLSTGIILGACVSLFGMSFVILGGRCFGYLPHPIRYGNGIVELPEKAASKRVVKLKRDEIIRYGVKSYILPFIRVFEVHSADESISISLDAFVDQGELNSLLKYLAEK